MLLFLWLLSLGLSGWDGARKWVVPLWLECDKMAGVILGTVELEGRLGIVLIGVITVLILEPLVLDNRCAFTSRASNHINSLT